MISRIFSSWVVALGSRQFVDLTEELRQYFNPLYFILEIKLDMN